MKILKINNKGLLMFDSVRFITSNLAQRFTLDLIKDLDDYHIIITHGVIGELINLIEKENFGVDKSKISILTNNIETQKLFNSYNYSTYCISEYIFTNDDVYTVEEREIKYDCIFPGREAKAYGLFENKYNVGINLLYKLPGYPFPREKMTQLFNESKVGLMTTEAEGSCLSVGEMLSCGLPVVSVKINNTIDLDHFYPHNKRTYSNTYGIVLPNTLGGRELWLDSGNSIYCSRVDSSIDEAITELVNKQFSKLDIRNDFLSKVNHHRVNFLYLVKSICDKLEIDFANLKLEEFISLPYGNSTVSSTGWKKAIENVKHSYLL